MFRWIRYKVTRLVMNDSGLARLQAGFPLAWGAGILAGAAVLLGTRDAYACKPVVPCEGAGGVQSQTFIGCCNPLPPCEPNPHGNYHFVCNNGAQFDMCVWGTPC